MTIFGYPGSEAEKYAKNNGLTFINENEYIERRDPVVDFVIDDGVLVRYLGNETEVIIPSGVGVIAFESFALHKNIKSVIMSNDTTNIEDFVFSDSSLENITLSEKLINIGSRAFSFCSNLKNITLPEGLKTIGDSAFAFSGLEEITIPASVENIGKEAFLGCNKLKTIKNISKIKI